MLHIKWKVERQEEPINPEDVPEDMGASQSVVLISCAEEATGGYSQVFYAFDGPNGGELSPRQLFKIWLMFGMQLARHYDIGALRKTVIESAQKAFFDAVGN